MLIEYGLHPDFGQIYNLSFTCNRSAINGFYLFLIDPEQAGSTSMRFFAEN